MHCNQESCQKSFVKIGCEPQAEGAECLGRAVLECLWDQVGRQCRALCCLPPSSSQSRPIMVGISVHAVWNPFPAHHPSCTQMSSVLEPFPRLPSPSWSHQAQSPEKAEPH